MTCNNCYLPLIPINETITDNNIKYDVFVCPDCDKVFYKPIQKIKYKNIIAYSGICIIIFISTIFIFSERFITTW